MARRRGCRRCRVVDGGSLCPVFLSDRGDRVCAMVPLVDTIIAKSPIPVVTVVALPVAGVGVCFTHVAEDARL